MPDADRPDLSADARNRRSRPAPPRSGRRGTRSSAGRRGRRHHRALRCGCSPRCSTASTSTAPPTPCWPGSSSAWSTRSCGRPVAFVVVPLSVLTLGLGAIVLDALVRVARARPAARRRGRRASGRRRRRRRSGRDRRRRVVAARRSTTTPGSTSAWPRRPAGASKGADVTDVPGVVFVQLDGVAQVGAAAGAALRRRPQPAPLAARRAPPPRRRGRPGGRRRPVSASAASCTARRCDMPAFRWVDKATGEVVVSNRPKSRGGDRAGPLRRQRPARPQRVELREPVLRRRRAGGADDERGRPAQGGADRRRLRRLLLAARAGDADVASASSSRSPASGARRTLQRRRGVEPRVERELGCTRCCARSRRWSAATCRVQGVINDIVRGPGGDLRRPARLRRGLPPLRSRARRHARRAARPRPPDRPHRPRVPRGRRARTSSSCCPTTARPRARRSTSAPARRSPSSSAGCAAARRVGRRGRRAGHAPSRRRGCARPGRPTATAEPMADDVPDRARFGQPRADLPAGCAPPACPRRDRRPLPGADRRACVAHPADRVRARRHRGRARSCSARTGSATSPPARSSVTIPWPRSARVPSPRSLYSWPPSPDMLTSGSTAMERMGPAAAADATGVARLPRSAGHASSAPAMTMAARIAVIAIARRRDDTPAAHRATSEHPLRARRPVLRDPWQSRDRSRARTPSADRRARRAAGRAVPVASRPACSSSIVVARTGNTPVTR